MLLAIAGIITFASCKKDETPAPLSKEEATSAITAVNSDYAATMSEIDALPGKQAIDAIDNLNLDFDTPMKAPIKQESLQTDILKVYKPSSSLMGDTPFLDFLFTENIGTWHKVNGTWVKTADQTNKVVIVFSYKGGTDNATLTYYDYATKTFNIGGESMTYMSQLSARVDIVGQTNPVVGWNYTASMSGSATSYTMKMNFVYTLGIYSRTQSLSMAFASGKTSSSINLSMLDEVKKNSEILYSTSISMTMKSATSSVTYAIDAKFRVKNIAIKWDINYDQNTNTNGNPGNFMTISVWTTDGAKVADVIFVLEGDKYVPWFKYSDGTTEKVSDKLGSDNVEGSLAWAIKEFMDEVMNFSLK